MDEGPTPDFTAVAPGPKGTCYARMIMCFLMIFIVVTEGRTYWIPLYSWFNRTLEGAKELAYDPVYDLSHLHVRGTIGPRKCRRGKTEWEMLIHDDLPFDATEFYVSEEYFNQLDPPGFWDTLPFGFQELTPELYLQKSKAHDRYLRTESKFL